MFKISLLCRNTNDRGFRARTGAAIAAAAVLALGLAACGSASGNTTSTESAASGSRTIRFGYVAGTDKSYINSVAQTVFGELGYKTELVPMTFDALIPSLQSGRVDAAGSGLFITPTRCQAATFSEPSKIYMNSMAVAKGNPHKLTSFEDLAKTGVKVGALAGAATRGQAIAAGVNEAQISTYQDLNTLLEAVQSGRVDVAPYDNATLAVELAKPAYSNLEATPPVYAIFDDGQKRPFVAGIAFQKSNTDLAKKYSEKQHQFFTQEGEKALEFAKQEGIPATAVPKGDEPFKTADYCAHASR